MKSQQQKPNLQPGPDHPITIEPTPGRVIVRLGGKIIADSDAALTLQESDYSPVQYVPRSDVKMTSLKRSDHSTYCPYKAMPRISTLLPLMDRK